jgi:rare lipoprotein A
MPLGPAQADCCYGTLDLSAQFLLQSRTFTDRVFVRKLVKAVPCVAVAWALAMGVPPGARAENPTTQTTTAKPAPDLSARKRVGKASFYARQFFGKTMANGAPMDPKGDNAASRTLPLGTTAKVTNVETGKTAVVTIEDRGPYVDGRVVDLSPGTAAKIGLTPRKGVTKVVVAPITVPLPDGKVKVGAAAHEPVDKPDQLPLKDEKPVKQKPTELASAERSDHGHARYDGFDQISHP